MGLATAFACLNDGVLPETFEGLKSRLNIGWVESALTAGEAATVRNRKLAGEQVVWLVVGMGLYRDRPIDELVQRLDLVLPDANGNRRSVSRGAIPAARDRVGAQPLRELFGTTAKHWALEWAEKDRWRGLLVFGADGTTLRVPDSAENREAFGLPGSGLRGTAGYPQIRAMGVMALRSHLIEIEVRRATRREHPELPETFRARAVRYRRKGFKPQILLTSLLDDEKYPAAEIAELYHERWELEIGYDEIKTHALEREEAIRSKSPERVAQEVWGLAVAYNLVRHEMAAVAEKCHVAPRRISFRGALRLIRDLYFWAEVASPGKAPKMIRDMRIEMEDLILPPRRSQRRYPRHVKIKMSNYARNVGHPGLN